MLGLTNGLELNQTDQAKVRGWLLCIGFYYLQVFLFRPYVPPKSCPFFFSLRSAPTSTRHLLQLRLSRTS